MEPHDIIFSPIKIKSMELKNRAVMPPMGTNLGREDGIQRDRLHLRRFSEPQNARYCDVSRKGHTHSSFSGSYSRRSVPRLSGRGRRTGTTFPAVRARRDLAAR